MQEQQKSSIIDGARDRLRSSINAIRDRVTTSETSFLHWLMHEGLEEDVEFALQLLNDQDLFPLPPPNHKALIEQHASARASLGGRRNSSISEVSQDFPVLPTTYLAEDMEEEFEELKIYAENDGENVVNERKAIEKFSNGEDMALSNISIAPKNDNLLPRSVSQGTCSMGKMMPVSKRSSMGAVAISRTTNTGGRSLTRSHSLPSMKLVDMEKRVKHIQKRRTSTRLSRVGLWKAHQDGVAPQMLRQHSSITAKRGSLPPTGARKEDKKKGGRHHRQRSLSDSAVILQGDIAAFPNEITDANPFAAAIDPFAVALVMENNATNPLAEPGDEIHPLDNSVSNPTRNHASARRSKFAKQQRKHQGINSQPILEESYEKLFEDGVNGLEGKVTSYSPEYNPDLFRPREASIRAGEGFEMIEKDRERARANPLFTSTETQDSCDGVKVGILIEAIPFHDGNERVSGQGVELIDGDSWSVDSVKEPHDENSSDASSFASDDANDKVYDAWNILKDEYALGYGGGNTLPFQIFGTSADDVDAHPHVLSPPLMESLQNFFPYALTHDNFWMKFSLLRDGASLYSLLQHIRGAAYTIIAVETTNGKVFGSFTTQPWRKGWKYFGNGECFLFRMRRSRLTPCASIIDQAVLESELDVYPATGVNDYYQLCTSDKIAIGGGEMIDSGHFNEEDERSYSSLGGDFGFSINYDLLSGSSSPCATFNNPCLCNRKAGDVGDVFQIANLEVWTLTPSSTLEDAEKLELGKLFLQTHGKHN